MDSFINFFKSMCMCGSKKSKKTKDYKIYNKYSVSHVRKILEREKNKIEIQMAEIEMKRIANASLVKYFAHLDLRNRRKENEEKIKKNMDDLKFLFFKHIYIDGHFSQLQENSEDYQIIRNFLFYFAIENNFFNLASSIK